jgi:hypothetical protein
MTMFSERIATVVQVKIGNGTVYPSYASLEGTPILIATAVLEQNRRTEKEPLKACADGGLVHVVYL